MSDCPAMGNFGSKGEAEAQRGGRGCESAARTVLPNFPTALLGNGDLQVPVLRGPRLQGHRLVVKA